MDTSGGVEGFWSPLCTPTLCSGFVGLFNTVSWLGGVYSQAEEGTFPKGRGLHCWSDGNNCHRRAVRTPLLLHSTAYTRHVQPEGYLGGIPREACIPGGST